MLPTTHLLQFFVKSQDSRKSAEIDHPTKFYANFWVIFEKILSDLAEIGDPNDRTAAHGPHFLIG